MEQNRANNQEIKQRQARILKGPTQVSLDITNRCNFNCLHCFNHSSKDKSDQLSDREVIAFIKDLADLEPHSFCICGGEPLLRFKLVLKVLRVLKEQATVNSMVTNGFLLTKKKAQRLAASGLDRIQVSLDGSKAESYERLRGVKGSYKRALEALEVAKQAGLTTMVSFCPTRFNTAQVKEVFYQARQRGVTEFRVQPLMLLGRAKENQLLPTKLQYRNLVRNINQLKRENYGTSLRIEWGDPIDHIMRYRSSLKSLAPVVGIRSDGAIAPSPYLPITVGNIKNYPLSQYCAEGLIRIWEFKLLRDVAAPINSLADLANQSQELPEVWVDDDLSLDLIEQGLLTTKRDMGLKEFNQERGN